MISLDEATTYIKFVLELKKDRIFKIERRLIRCGNWAMKFEKIVAKVKLSEKESSSIGKRKGEREESSIIIIKNVSWNSLKVLACR